MTTLQWIRGAWRHWWGQCPECNSDAPAIDTCEVCRAGWKFRGEPGNCGGLWWIHGRGCQMRVWNRFVEAHKL